MAYEKRYYHRFSVKMVANCSRKKNDPASRDYFLSFTKDISLGGSCIVMNKKVEVGDWLVLSIEIPQYFIPVLAYGHVKWLKLKTSTGTTGIYEAGVSFLNTSVVEYLKMSEFIKNLELKNSRYSSSSSNRVVTDTL